MTLVTIQGLGSHMWLLATIVAASEREHRHHLQSSIAQHCCQASLTFLSIKKKKQLKTTYQPLSNAREGSRPRVFQCQQRERLFILTQ